MKDLNNKIVVITGAASGMGRAYAHAFAAQGCKLALCDFDSAGLAETVKQLGPSLENRVVQQGLDVSDRTAMMDFAETVRRRLGPAHIIINNAGIEGSAKPSWATTIDDYRRVMEVNYFGVVNGCQAFLPQLRENTQGAIVNISSIFGLVGTPNHSDYCASKFAVRGYTEALMVELLGSPIQVHLVHPGGIDTNIARQPRSRAFSEHFLSTPPEAIATKLIACIRRNQARLIFGNGATKTWLGARLLPLGALSKMLWREMRTVIDLDDYPNGSGQK